MRGGNPMLTEREQRVWQFLNAEKIEDINIEELAADLDMNHLQQALMSLDEKGAIEFEIVEAKVRGGKREK